jgi:hypothetical protein
MKYDNSVQREKNNRSLIMNCDVSCTISLIEEPTFTIPKDYPFGNYFHINFHYDLVNFPLHSNASNSILDCTTTINRTLLVPCDILLDRKDNILYEYYFSSLPISSHISKEILPQIGQHAREMVANDDEDQKIWEIDVKLDVNTWYIEDNDAVKALLVVDRLKRVGMDHSSRYSTDRCAICLEELFDGSKSEQVMTNCLHVFHKECIFQWLKRCFHRQSSLSCPLCRKTDEAFE